MTVIVATIGALVEFVAVNDEIFPLPFAARPIAVLLFVQKYVVPATVPLNVTAVLELPLHKTCEVGVLAVGVGLIVAITVKVEPEHDPIVGVTVYVAVCVVVVEFVNVPNTEDCAVPPAPPVIKPVTVGVSQV